MIRVLIVDDERNIRKAFISDINSASDRYVLVDAISNAGSAESYCASHMVDMILMDINTDNYENGIEVSAQIKARYPEIKIIIVTSYTDHRSVEQARKIGVESFWFKDYSDIELLDVMDITAKGNSYYPDTFPAIRVGDAGLDEFTKAQLGVLYLLPDYFSNKNIADKLGIAEETVKVHIREIMQKTGCHSRAQLISLITRAKLVVPQRDFDI